MKHLEQIITNSRGVNLFYQEWLPDEAERSAILLLHGFGEHSSRYQELAEHLVSKGISLHAFDYQGHGRSEGKRGVFHFFSHLYHDIDQIAGVVLSKNPRKFGVLGHSLGGLLALGWALRFHGELDAVIVSSPLLGLSLDIPLWKKLASKAFSHLLPWVTFRATVDPRLLTHDPRKVAEYATDPLVHQDANGQLFYGMIKEAEFVNESAKRFHYPLLLLLAGEDHIVDVSTSLRFYENAASQLKKCRVYEGWYHEIFNELERAKLFRDLTHWLEGVLLR
ncbi:MAG: lysophospholipase [Deltaproteobacteria bacterium]|nr:lysophospholipase [Deltaproteobacteria bacterium]